MGKIAHRRFSNQFTASLDRPRRAADFRHSWGFIDYHIGSRADRFAVTVLPIVREIRAARIGESLAAIDVSREHGRRTVGANDGGAGRHDDGGRGRGAVADAAGKREHCHHKPKPTHPDLLHPVPSPNTRNGLSQSSIAGVISASAASPATVRVPTASGSDRRTTAVRSPARRRDRHIMAMICGRGPMPSAF